MFWHKQMCDLVQISRKFSHMITRYQLSQKMDKRVKVHVLCTKTTKDQSLESITERNRMDLQATTIVLRLTQLLLHEIRFSTESRALYFLFTVACVVLDQPEHGVRIHNHIQRTFFPSTCHLSHFFTGFFEIHVESPSQSYRDGKIFMTNVRTMLAFDT